MGPQVRLEHLGEEKWRVSVVRPDRRSSVVQGGHDHVTKVAWRAVSLLNLWDGMLPDGRLIAKGRRYLVVERAGRLGTTPVVLASFATFELALTFLWDEMDHGNRDAAIYDRSTHELVLDPCPERVPLDWLAAWRRGHGVRGTTLKHRARRTSKFAHHRPAAR
jgi:hypothetical protein